MLVVNQLWCPIPQTSDFIGASLACACGGVDVKIGAKLYKKNWMGKFYLMNNQYNFGCGGNENEKI